MSHIPQAEWKIAKSRPSHDWPQEGVVSFNNYSTRYRHGLDLVLKGVTFSTNSCEKVCFLMVLHIGEVVHLLKESIVTK